MFEFTPVSPLMEQETKDERHYVEELLRMK